MLRACGLRASVRIGLLQHNDPNRMLLFEAPRAAARAAASPAASSDGVLASDADVHGEVIATSMSLTNTLLASALAEKQARFVSDCGLYMQVRRRGGQLRGGGTRTWGAGAEGCTCRWRGEGGSCGGGTS